MTDEVKPQRRSLTGGLGAIRNDPAEAPERDVALSPAAVRAGFDTVPVPMAEVEQLRANQTPQLPRRTRGAGRSVPFSLKLRPDTLEYIYSIANGRNIPLAQVIEELVDAHMRSSQQG
ncbi:hypothetical protein [Sphingomonas sp. BK481]|uniref:hypothetical protein n=1 Tax=Sphingomonas sp. BK481 TaxID=2586981 RepID=UPI00161C3C06|nr:hypothetical protein [Sphingomonas sp. BK481]MBB3588976.1 hypothetical protein [Sphingomonas sp. BK481]